MRCLSVLRVFRFRHTSLVFVCIVNCVALHVQFVLYLQLWPLCLLQLNDAYDTLGSRSFIERDFFFFAGPTRH